MQNTKQGQLALVKFFGEWAAARTIEKKTHKKEIVKEKRQTRNHSVDSGNWVERRNREEIHELLLKMVFAWWLLSVFEDQMVKEIREPQGFGLGVPLDTHPHPTLLGIQFYAVII